MDTVGGPDAAVTGTDAALWGVIGSWAAMPHRGVIFDFNGTLSDDEDILRAIFAELFAAHLGWELTAEEYFARLAGHSDREIVEIAVAERAPGQADLVETLLRLRRERYQEIVASESPIGPGAVALVQRLVAEGVPLAIVTGAQRQDVEVVLAGSPAGEAITLLVTEEDVRRGKPDPEGFLMGAELLGLPPEQILVFEDSRPGLLAARAAGMPCIAVRGRQASARLADVADAEVESLDASILDHAG